MTCQTCQSAVPPGARFCPGCGARLTGHPALSTTAGGEHRQITVMFADLVGSTRLSAELHPEDLRELLRSYQQICADEVERGSGMIASYMGDGVMAYFGYPRASEDAAIRAADAALGVTRRVTELGERLKAEQGIDLATRVALHTGRVLVGQMGSGENRDHHAITGIVPNLAARLEGLAPRNGIVVSEQTRALIVPAFRVEPMGHYDLKGIPAPVQAFRVLGRNAAAGVLQTSGRPLVGRAAKLEALRTAWHRACAGTAVLATVVAEAGAGKTATAAAFINEARIQRSQLFELAGTQAGQNSPFACMRETVARHLNATGATRPHEAREALRQWLGGTDAGTETHVEILTALWRGETAEGPEGRGSLFAAAAALIDALPAPVLLVLEDAHWIDPSTLELVDRLMAASSAGRLVLSLTRPDAPHVWSRPEDPRLLLDRLSSEGCREMIEAVAGCKVETSLARRIEAATDGLPLYVEEFTKALIELGFVDQRRGVLRAVDLDASVETPTSLLDLITSRLDMLGNAKSLAQIAAVLGRQFDHDALVAVSQQPAGEVDQALNALKKAGIVASMPDGGIGFRHALFQNAAYESLLRPARRTWHRRYLDWLKSAPERMAAIRPETIAFHLEACDEHRDAAERYVEAGLAANRASASREAAVHFARARDLLAIAPPPAAPGALEAHDGLATARLRAQVLLAGALLSSSGPGAAETRAAYDEALRLAEAVPESDWHLAAYWGWWRVSDSFAAMAVRARRLLEVSKRMHGAEFKLQAMHCAWANTFLMGELDASVETARDGLELYEEAGFDHLRTLYGGHDCKVCALGETALATWLLGAGDAASAYADQALAHADALGHVGSLLHALDIAIMLHHYRRDGDAVARHAERLLALGTEHDLDEYRAKADVFLGWREIDAGRQAAGLDRLDAGFAILLEIGTPEDFPVYQCMRAEALRHLGDPDAALDALRGGRAVLVEQGVAFWAAEIARQEAEAELSRERPNEAFVAQRLEEAERIASSQNALALMLRTRLTALAFARRIGRTAHASSALAEVLDRFAPAAGGRDIEDARAALAAAPES